MDAKQNTKGSPQLNLPSFFLALASRGMKSMNTLVRALTHTRAYIKPPEHTQTQVVFGRC